MDGPAGIVLWHGAILKRRSYRPSVEVILPDGKSIKVIPVQGQPLICDRTYETFTGTLYYGMHQTVLADLYDLLQE